MGIFDQAKEFADQHADQIEQGIDKAGDFVDEKTDSKYAGQVDQAQAFLKDKIGPGDEPAAPPTAPPAS